MTITAAAAAQAYRQQKCRGARQKLKVFYKKIKIMIKALTNQYH
jgi:hypothetical protein